MRGRYRCFRSRSWEELERQNPVANSRFIVGRPFSASGQSRRVGTGAVPAGTFHALRVDVTIRGMGRLGCNDTTYITYWYARECNRFVKLHFGNENQGILDAGMVSYKRARW
jgi:hypothetical protein